MNITEGNQVIAKYLGLDIKTTHTGWKYYDTKEGRTGLNDLKFHSSWGWIMPVVEKISQHKMNWDNPELVEPFEDYCFPRTFGHRDYQTGEYMVRFNAHGLFIHKEFITAVWLAVVDFIQVENEIKCAGN